VPLHRYPVTVAHDSPLDETQKRSLARLGSGPLSFVQLKNELPPHLSASEVPEKVLGFSVDYRYMIRWKAGLLWLMPELQRYE